ncbi:MAG: hypothetical protein ABI268_08105, partial [Rhodanobacter sp.]
DVEGAKFAGNWTSGERIEMDFFGGFNGNLAYIQQQPTARLRHVDKGLGSADRRTMVGIGQQWDLMFLIDNARASLPQLAFALNDGAGVVGRRFSARL